MATKLSKREEILVDEGADIDNKITTLTSSFAKVKEALADLPPGTYITKKGNHVKITEDDKYADPDPREVYDIMKEKKLGARFFGVVKIALGELKSKKFLTDLELSKLRPKLGGTVRKYSFK